MSSIFIFKQTYKKSFSMSLCSNFQTGCIVFRLKLQDQILLFKNNTQFSLLLLHETVL